jgi:hypothetical protein
MYTAIAYNTAAFSLSKVRYSKVRSEKNLTVLAPNEVILPQSWKTFSNYFHSFLPTNIIHLEHFSSTFVNIKVAFPFGLLIQKSAYQFMQSDHVDAENTSW